ncbi:MAG: hypothetical protein K2N23_02100 [Clostridia bacterium]|nr:hypothetical protein [Clostridia bacterium]
MNFFKDPKIWFLIPVIIIAIGSTVGATLFMTQESLADYKTWGVVFIGIMAVSVSYSVYGVIRLYPKAKEAILKWSKKHPFWDRQFSEYGFTTLLFTAFSLAVTLAFAVYNGSVAIVISSIWFGALAGYNVLLIVLYGSILIYHGKRKRALAKGLDEGQILIQDAKRYRVYGVMLFLLPVCLSFAIMQMVAYGDSFVHTGITIYVYAIYAFYKIITAVYNVIKEWKNSSMPIMAARNIKLADAFVSILALQTAMFREFSEGFDEKTVITFNAVTGLIVCLLTVALGVFMIIDASLKIRKIKTS